MGNVLEFYLRMKDMMSSGLIKVAATAKSNFKQIESYIDRATASSKRFGDSFDTTSRKINNSGNSLSNWVRNIGLAVTAAGAFSFATGSVKSAMEFGATKESFKVLTGDPRKGEALASGLNKLQQDTILGPEVFKNAQTMMGFGIGAERVIPTIKMLGDVSMGNADKMQGLTLAFSQVQAAGRLTGQDLLQFINAGFNPLNEISKQTGVSIGGLKKKMEEGAISASMVTAAFESATSKGGLFHNMMNKLADTPMGKMQQLMGKFEALKINVGETMMPIATSFMEVANFLMDHLELVVGVGAAWAGYMVVTKAATVAQWALNAAQAANPMGLLIALVVGLVAWIITMVKANKNWQDSFKAIWEMIKAFGQMAWIPFKMFGEQAWFFVERLWLQIKDFAQSVVGIFGNIKNAWDLAWSGDFKGAKNALFSQVTTGASKEISDLENKHLQNQAGYVSEFAQAQQRFVENQKKIDFRITKNGKVTAADSSGSSSQAGKSGTFGDLQDDKLAKGVTGGGPRIINIHGVKFMDKLELHTTTFKEGIQEMEAALENMFLKILNSGASVQS